MASTAIMVITAASSRRASRRATSVSTWTRWHVPREHEHLVDGRMGARPTAARTASPVPRGSSWSAKVASAGGTR